MIDTVQIRSNASEYLLLEAFRESLINLYNSLVCLLLIPHSLILPSIALK